MIGSNLVAFNDITKRAIATIDLKKATGVEDDQEARVALSTLQRAFTEAERIIPGVTLELINEIVDSVEHVEDDR